MFEIVDEKRDGAVIKVIGVGGCGGNAVEHMINKGVAGVEFMDYVAPGRVIVLGAKDVLVLGYLRSCWRETITGGTVTVGEVQSVVQAGRVERSQVACGGSRAQPVPREATQSAATVFRSMQPRPQAAEQPVPVGERSSLPGRMTTV